MTLQRKARRIVARVLTPILVLSRLALSEAGEAELSRFRAAYPAALDRLQNAYSRLEANGSLRGQDGGVIAVDVAVLGDLRKAAALTSYGSGEAAGKPAYEFVFCVGSQANFMLKRDFQNGPSYTIQNINRNKLKNQDSDKPSRGFSGMAGKFVFSPFSMSSLHMRDVLNDANYKVLDAEEAEEGGTTVFRIRFASTDNPRDPHTRGIVELLPGSGWAIRRCEIEGVVTKVGVKGAASRAKYKQLMEVAYAPGEAEVPTPARVRHSSGPDEETFDFASFRVGTSTPEREFTVGRYGLPEITAPPADPASGAYTYWLIGLASTSLVAAFLIRRRNGR